VKKLIYLDNNATTQVHPEVVEIMDYCLTEYFGNPSTIYSFGKKAKRLMDESREKIAKMTDASKDEIVFTSGGTEADNLAIFGIAKANKDKGKHIITSKIEHHAVINSCKALEKEGFEVTYLDVDKYGIVNLEQLERTIKKETILISIMHANNEIGTIEPIAEIGRIAKRHKIYFHSDTVQSIGKIRVDVKEMNLDMISISSHKLYGPKGIGCLYVKKGTRIKPILYGGEQEHRLRAGTENVPGIAGFGRAMELAITDTGKENERLTKLRDRLQEGLSKRIKHIVFNGHPSERLPNTLNCAIQFIEGESLILKLDDLGICASTGSACSSASLEPSHVLMAIGLPHEIAHGSLRLSLGRDTTDEDIDYVLDVLPKAVEELRAFSPLYKEFLKKGGKP
jgi:cysteine desulfurase